MKPYCFTEEEWASIADGWQSYWYGSQNKDPHPLRALEDGIIIGYRKALEDRSKQKLARWTRAMNSKKRV